MSPTLPPYPPSAKLPVTETYHGVEVTENYRWLENFDDPAVRDWLKAQNARTKTYLEAFPGRAALLDDLKALYNAPTFSYTGLQSKGGLIFAMKRQPPKQQAFLVTLYSPNDLSTERVVLDPNLLDPNGLTAIDLYVPSHDGRYAAVVLSKSGSEDGTVYVYEVETGKQLDDVVPHAYFPTAGGSIAWKGDGSGFYRTRYPHEGPPEDAHFYEQVYFHRLGTPASADTYELGEGFPRIAEIDLSTSDDGRYTLATVANGDGGEFAHYLRSADGQWQQITEFADRVTSARFGQDGSLYLLSLNDAPRGKILRLPLATPELSKAEVFVPQSDVTIEAFLPMETLLYTIDMVGGPNQMRAINLSDGHAAPIPIAPVSSVRQIAPLNSKSSDSLLYLSASYFEPQTWFHFDPQAEEPQKTAMASPPPCDFSDAVVTRAFATSKDGTQIPVNVMHRKDLKLDGSNPTILYGYGAYGICIRPNFDMTQRIWLDQGGVYVVANLRGGGEFGDDWHRQGNLTKKQTVFDDFIAAAEYLISAGYTTPEKLVIEGGSNGGLLVGAALTQRPDLYRAVLAYVGIYDMLRVELDPNGQFNITEFGTVTDAEQFRALYAYSPYHNVRDGAAYPAVMLIAGDHDHRVNPMQSRKMAARLQAGTSATLPVLLRTSSTAGHGMGTSRDEQIATDADAFTFVFSVLEMDYQKRSSTFPGKST
jgi:prolyl oligopeptidase